MTDRPEFACPRCGTPLEADQPSCGFCGLDVRSLFPTLSQDPEKSPSPMLHGSRIGDYDILRELGRGGMGVVYEAYQRSMHRKVALKILDVGFVPSADEVARFEREAWIGGRLSHPNIVKVYGQGVFETKHYFAMELIEGSSLHDVIREAKALRTEKPLSLSAWRTGHVRRMVERFAEVAGALAHVHEQGIVHRDIKPGNLLLSKDGARLLLTDFGLARDEDAARMTRKGDFLGTVRYMSPEQLLAHRVKIDRRSDIYSLGVSLYEAVALRLPFDADSEEAYIAAVTTREPLPARHWSKAVPRDLETVLLKCLDRDPAGRYATATELRSDLVRYLEGHPVQARRPGIVMRATRAVARRPAMLAGSLLAFILGSLGVWSGLEWRKSRDDQATLRWVLEEAATRGIEPSKLTPEWLRLGPTLIHALDKEPDGELAQLFRRAACRVETELSATFGLVSQPPQVSVRYANNSFESKTFDLGGDWTCYQQVDLSWDGGEWTPVMWCGLELSREGGWGGVGFNFKFDEVLGSAEMTPGPHALDLRVRRVMRRERLPERLRTVDRLPCGTKESLEDLWISERWSEPLDPFVMRIGRHVVNLFEHYPDSFPRKVMAGEESGGLERWFNIDRIEVQHIEVGPRPDRAMLAVPDGSGPYCPQQDPSKDGYLHTIELIGRLEQRTPLPIRAEGTLKVGSTNEPLATFTFCWGFNEDAQIEARTCACSSHEPAGGVAPGCTVHLRVPWNSSWPDGDYQGLFELLPSRTVALKSGNTDSYYGERIGLQLPVKVTTGQGTWSTKEQCDPLVHY